MPSSSNDSSGMTTGIHHGSGSSNINGIPYPPEESEDVLDADPSLLREYPDDVDYYSLLGLSKHPPPTDSRIRSAYRTLTLSFHPDKQPLHLREVAENQFEKIREAYETLIDPKKRTIYDLLGAKGVRREWSAGGVMGRGGVAEKQQIGVKVMNADEFRHWFLEAMKARERQVVNSLVHARGSISLGIDATSMISTVENEDSIYLHFPSLHPTSYSIGYSFKAPLPAISNLFSGIDEKEEIESGDEERGPRGSQYDRDENSTHTNQSTSEVGEISFAASVGGQIRTPTRTFDLTYEDGSTETKDLPLPPLLIAKNISLGASVSHNVRNDNHAKSLYRKVPFSFMDGANVGISGQLLPYPLFETSFSKPIIPFPGTKPLIIRFSSIFPRPPISAPPIIGIEVSRRLGLRQHLYCSWSSGSLSWPFFLQRRLSPIIRLGIAPILAFSIPVQVSKLQIGYISLPKQSASPRNNDAGDSTLVGEGADHENPAEFWQFQASAFPGSGSIAVTYSRNMFSRKADDFAISEWNSEGYHPLPKSNEPSPVRLEIETIANLDLSLSWSILGTRRVGNFTSLGLGIGVSGGKGLVITVSWSRLGQKINLPIAICPLGLVNPDVAALAVVIPWATYCGIEFGYTRRRERRRLRLELSKRQRALKKSISKKKYESQQAINLMSDQVRRRQAKEEVQGGLVITRAEYGYIPPLDRGVNGDAAKKRLIDVKIPVAALVDHSQLVIPHDIIKFQIIGFYDPAPLLPKTLKIWYTFNGYEHIAEANDSEGIICPTRSQMVSK
jgi:DnaJ family protein C protein 11